MNPAEAIQEDYEFRSGVDTDVACSDCGEPAVVRFVNGEPVEESAVTCHCGGELMPV